MFLLCIRSHASLISETADSELSEGIQLISSRKNKNQVLSEVDRCIKNKLKTNLSPYDCGKKPNVVSNAYLEERIKEIQAQFKVAIPPMCEGMEYSGCHPEHRAAVAAIHEKIIKEKRTKAAEQRRQCRLGRCNN